MRTKIVPMVSYTATAYVTDFKKEYLMKNGRLKLLDVSEALRAYINRLSFRQEEYLMVSEAMGTIANSKPLQVYARVDVKLQGRLPSIWSKPKDFEDHLSADERTFINDIRSFCMGECEPSLGAKAIILLYDQSTTLVHKKHPCDEGFGFFKTEYSWTGQL